MKKQPDKSPNPQEIYRVLLERNIPFASYRLPDTQEIYTLIQQYAFPEKIYSLNETEGKSGFIIAPFSAENGDDIFFLSPDTIWRYNQRIDEKILAQLRQNNLFLRTKKPKNTFITTPKKKFIDNVEKVITDIGANSFQKAVISRVKVEKMHPYFRVEKLFLKLCDAYPSAMVYLFNTPETGCWTGATPEVLLTVENDLAKTMSLAGTRAETKKAGPKNQWTTKEIEEQQLVTGFIEKVLERAEITYYKKSDPHDVKAGKLIHLQTTFEFPFLPNKQKINHLLQLLHPTPATGGLPKNEARNFILNNETHNRQYYTGFFGVVNIHQQSHLYVNLRCAQLFEKEYVLYAGAGIISSSIAEKEWLETENKMQTLKSVISEVSNKNETEI